MTNHEYYKIAVQSKRRAVHYLIARLNQQDLIYRIRPAAEDDELLLWGMIGLNNFYEIVTAGPVTAGKPRRNVWEIFGYNNLEEKVI